MVDLFDLNNYEFMEVEQGLPNSDPNLNVTSAPEQFDLLNPYVETTIQMYQGEPTPILTEMTRVVDPLPIPIEFANTIEFAPEYDNNFSADKCPGPPALLTLVKPHMVTPTPGHDQDMSDSELLKELYQGDEGETVSVSSNSCNLKGAKLRLHQSPTDDDVTDGTGTLDLEYEERAASPSDSLGTLTSEEPSVCSSSVACLPAGRETDIERKATYIREVIEKRNNKPDDMSSKLKVHEVILVILLNSAHGDKTKDLQRILTFCDESGKETSGSDCRHFKTLDTETMGLLWQKIKGNKKGNYDTFARAMRVRRERSSGFFDYLESGKGKKKRIYRLGDRSMEEMNRFKRTLKQVSRPQACSY